MLTKPLRRIFLAALAGAILAEAIALKQRTGSRSLASADSTPVADRLARDGEQRQDATGDRAHGPSGVRSKRQERFISDVRQGEDCRAPTLKEGSRSSSSAPAEDTSHAGKAPRLYPSRQHDEQ